MLLPVLMVKMKFATWFGIAPALTLFSCAPKAVEVVEVPAPKVEKPEEPAALPPTGNMPPDDGIRLPDMLSMPGEGEFRATRQVTPRGVSDSGAVIARPPTDPPSRPKATDGE